MIKLVYDLKAGFDNCYLTIKNEEWDLVDALEVFVPSEEYDGVPEIEYIQEEDFYNKYKDDIEALLDHLESIGHLEMLYEDSVLSISKLYFSHMLGGLPLKHYVTIWEPSNWRLVYESDKRSTHFYDTALSAGEVMKMLKLTRQQLHYYAKTGQLRKEFNPDNPSQFKYNELDVHVLQKKLEKKYDRFVNNL